MTAISVRLPGALLQESREIAKQLGVSQEQFVKRAIVHELEAFKKKHEQEAMAKCFAAMKNHPDYLAELSEIEMGLNSELPEDEDEWWTKAK